jgi:hypothetical protein
MSKDRLQANFRTTEDAQRMIVELRQSMLIDGKVPSETAIWLKALAEMHARHVRASDKKGSRK